MEVKMDLRKDELAMLFREYEEIMVSYAWGNEPTGSGALFRMANKKLPEGETISRASVIFAANRFVDTGLWDFNDRTGKGGHHKVYFAKMTQPEMWKNLAGTFLQKVVDASGLSREELLAKKGRKTSPSISSPQFKSEGWEHEPPNGEEMAEYNLRRRFKDMKLRCYNPNHPSYPYYGGRGITICQEWLDDSSAFVEWALKNGFRKDLEIDRINNEGPYSPENCHWVTHSQQMKNRRYRTGMRDHGKGYFATNLEKGMRTCSKCKEEKSLEEFYRDKTRLGGREYVCKSCKYPARNAESNPQGGMNTL